LDSSRPIKFYFELFMNRAKTKYFRNVFPEDKPIEN
jgi:hypothetical protein